MRKPRVLLVALLLLLALAGVAAAGGGATPPRGYVPPLAGPEGPVRLTFEGLRPTGQALVGGDHFSAKALRDLLILVEYRDLAPGPHTQRLQLYLPDGALYQQFTTAVEAGGAAQGRAEAHPEHARAPRAPGEQPGKEQVVTRLPVGGTWITQYSLYGTWHVEVYLDQARTPTVHRTLVLAP
ncbi:MAG: hypothetical protein ACHQ7N_04110 [Candidatus Methylomirabilales bacterium]